MPNKIKNIEAIKIGVITVVISLLQCEVITIKLIKKKKSEYGHGHSSVGERPY